MMKKQVLILVLASLLAVPSLLHAGGFALMEMTARGNAVGNALVGSTRDASAAYYNPANLGEVTNIAVQIGCTFIRPLHAVGVDGLTEKRMDSGWFEIPHAFVVIPLPWRLTLGLAEYSEFGVGTKYGSNWSMIYDSRKTTVEQITASPVLAWQVTDDFSIAAGARISWLSFENYAQPYAYLTGYMSPIYTGAESHLKGSDVSAGWLLAAQYRILDSLRAGIVYRSPIRHTLDGDFDLASGGTALAHSRAEASVQLPQSITFGLNWDVTDAWRLGFMASWMRWSSMQSLDISLPELTSETSKCTPLHWKDTWRIGLGTEYDLTDWMTVRGGYQFDMDPSNGDYTSTMMSAGHRHFIGLGVGFRLPFSTTLDIGYTCILQEDSTRYFAHPITGSARRFDAYDGLTHVVTATLGWQF